MVTFSVLMPAYNHERFVSDAIESVLGQSFTDLELVIIDDSSRDSTPDIIRRYADSDPRVRAYFHVHNQGISRTLNEALELARGRFVAVINSDDAWYEDKLRRQWEILRDNGDLVVWTEGELVDGEGNATGMAFTECSGAAGKRKSGDIFRELVEGNYVLHSSLAVRRESMLKFRYDEGLKYNNDHKLLVDLASENVYAFIPEALVRYRVHGDNAVFHCRDEWDGDYLRLYGYFLDRYGGRFDERLKALLYIYRCRICERQGMRSNAQRLLSRALTLQPEDLRIRYKALVLGCGFFRGEHIWALPDIGGRKGLEGAHEGRVIDACNSRDRDQAMRFEQGLEMALRGRRGEALQAFSETSRHPELAAVSYVNMGIIWRLEGDREKGLACLGRALELDDENAYAIYNRGVILDREGEFEGASALYARVVELLEEGANRAVAATAELSRGVCLAGMGFHEEAARCMEKAARLNPCDTRAIFNRACCLELEERFEEAIRGYEEALRSDSGMMERVELKKGLCLERLGRWREAARRFDRILAANPRDGEAWMEKATCFHALGERERAYELYLRAVAVSPDNAEAWRRMGLLLRSLGEPEKALECFREALKLDSRDPEILACIADSSLELGESGEAAAFYVRALEEDGSCVPAWFGLGLSHFRAGRYDRALECFDEAVELDPLDAAAWNERGNTLACLGRTEESRLCYLRALEQEEGMAEAWFNLAVAEEELRNMEGAARALRRFLEHAGGDWEEYAELTRRRLDFLEGEGSGVRRR